MKFCLLHVTGNNTACLAIAHHVRKFKPDPNMGYIQLRDGQAKCELALATEDLHPEVLAQIKTAVFDPAGWETAILQLNQG